MTEIAINNEEALSSALEAHPVADFADMDAIRSLVALYESGITGRKDNLGNDTAISESIKKHPFFCKEAGAGWRVTYNLLAKYARATKT